MIQSSKPTQKQVERWQFDRFRKVSGELAEYRVVDCEEPDFLVHGSERSVGVELIDLYWEQTLGAMPHQAIESLRARIAERAGRIYAASGLPPLHVSIHFNPNFTPTKKDVPRLSHAIAKLVAANVPEEGCSFEEDYDWLNREYFPEEISHLRAARFPVMQKSFFSSPGAAFIPELTKEDIERALVSKEPKVSSYRRQCSELWLVINCDGGHLATVFEHDDEAVRDVFASSFDRVFLFRHIAAKVHELRLRRGHS